jgi:hypothetical protein
VDQNFEKLEREQENLSLKIFEFAIKAKLASLVTFLLFPFVEFSSLVN